MPLALSVSEHLRKFQFFDSLPEDFDKFITSLGWPKFRAEQIREWVYRRLVVDPHEMTNLSKLDRQRLADSVSFFSAQTTVHQSSNDGTEKLLLTWPDSSG